MIGDLDKKLAERRALVAREVAAEDGAMMLRWKVFDEFDRWLGNWYAHDEVSAIRKALAEGYAAWSARPLNLKGW